jgi:putative ATPase
VSGDLFAAKAAERLAANGPLAARLRPKRFEDVVGQDHLIGPGAPLRVLVDQQRVKSGILWGPPGTGKTTLARLIAEHSHMVFEPLSAVTAGVKDVRDAIDRALKRLGERGERTILFVDEVHRFSKSQQDALLPAVEDGTVVLLGATTENPFFEINAPLLSRATLWRVAPLDEAALELLADRGAKAEGVELPSDVRATLIAQVDGDARALLTTLEVAAALAAARGGDPTVVSEGDLLAARSGVLLNRSSDTHYDQVSAFIKSIRGSDPDAGLYWMLRLLNAGEDPVFLARRLVILASEDIGMADPMSLVLASAAADAVRLVGLPEAKLNLAQAVIHLALAPKSNSVTIALSLAERDAALPRQEVPAHLRDGHYAGAKTLGHGVAYRYPHDDPRGWVEQTYRPDDLEQHVYYQPLPHGSEPQRSGWRSSRRSEDLPSEGA